MRADSSAIDLIVQTSTVELFGSYDVPVAPVSGHSFPPTSPPTGSLIVGLIEFTAEQFCGQLSLSVTTGIAQATSNRQGSVYHAEADWVKELTSQLMGRIKSRLARFGIKLRVGLPTATIAGAVGRHLSQSGEQLAYTFHTLKGDVSVTLTGAFSHGNLSYAQAGGVVEERGVILF